MSVLFASSPYKCRHYHDTHHNLLHAENASSYHAVKDRGSQTKRPKLVYSDKSETVSVVVGDLLIPVSTVDGIRVCWLSITFAYDPTSSLLKATWITYVPPSNKGMKLH